MLRILHKKQGQAVTGEYALLIVIAVGVVTVMTVFFQRTIQGRIHAARRGMFNIVRTYAPEYQGNLVYEYEPYYLNTVTEVQSQVDDRSYLLDGGASGISRQILNQETRVQMQSETAPPRVGD